MWVAADNRALESDECLERDPGMRARADRARAHAEAMLEEFERLELEWVAEVARRQGDSPETARFERALELSLTREDRLRLAFCDAILAGV